MSRLRLAVVGVGHLGKEHARILSGRDEIDLVGVADLNYDQAQAVARRCNTRAVREYRSLLHHVDAAIIVTPTTTHFDVAADFLRNGVSLLVEKPLAANLAQAEELVSLAQSHGAVLQVGHIERFNPAFEELRRRPLKPKFILGQRLGLYTGRSTDIGAVFDLMIHDLDLLLALIDAPVNHVSALGVSMLGGREDMAHARLQFGNGCVAELMASRISLEPSRRMHLWGPEGYASIDFARRGLTLAQPTSEALGSGGDPNSTRTPWNPAFHQSLNGSLIQSLELDCNQGDQLTRELDDFLLAVTTGSAPRVSGEDGCRAVALAGRIVQSIENHCWEPGSAFKGPLNSPPSSGQLFTPHADEAAA